MSGLSRVDEAAIEQRRDALNKARETQVLCAQLRRDLKSANATDARFMVAHVLLEDERFWSMRVEALLKCVHKWGPEKIRLVCARADVRQTDRVSDVSPGRREVLAGVLRGEFRVGRGGV